MPRACAAIMSVVVLTARPYWDKTGSEVTPHHIKGAVGGGGHYGAQIFLFFGP